MTTKKSPTEEELLEYFTTLNNWGRWGKDDTLGTLNLVTPEKRAQAARLVQRGISVGCARPIVRDLSAPAHVPQPMHLMIESGEAFVSPASAERGPTQFTNDYVGLPLHFPTVTHIDALSHVHWEGKMYNGHPSELVTTIQGAKVHDIDSLKDGFVTRGVLLDITKVRGKQWFDPGEAVFPEDLEAAEKAQGVRVEEGDAMLVRIGWFKRGIELGPSPRSEGLPGLNAAVIPWLHQRGVALIGTDGTQDARPNGYKNFSAPVHQVGIVAMGLWLLDDGNFEGLAQTCQELNRWEFLFMLSPLRIPGATASPVTPLAMF